MQPKELEAYKSLLEMIGSFYTTNKLINAKVETIPVHVKFEETDSAFCTKDHLVCLPPGLIDLFDNCKLPKLCIFYHELGHALYSDPMYRLIERWKNMINITYAPKYMHLMNWIEDFYIEAKLTKTYPYLYDIIRCLSRVKVEYNILDIDKAFNYYYINKKATPTLNQADQIQFQNYINTLINYRNDRKFKGVMHISDLSDPNTNYIKQIIAFYNWCVDRKIFPEDKCLPPLQVPLNIVTEVDLNSISPNTIDSDSIDNINTNQQCDDSVSHDAKQGTYTDHSHAVGKMMVQKFPDVDTTSDIFVDELNTERKLLEQYTKDYCAIDTSKQSIDGLFGNSNIDTSIISKPNIKRFFDNRHLEDRVLYKQPNRVFNNVSIYRDISGSTNSGNTFKLMDTICSNLIKDIPVDVNFYLYSSGKISIIKTDYIKWNNYKDVPDLYEQDPLFKQLNGGTNSDAIADVITEQLDDKWLNIIVTDGDLNSLLRRKNINSLLNNVAIINVDSEIDSPLINRDHYVFINDEKDLYQINNMLLNYRKE